MKSHLTRYRDHIEQSLRQSPWWNALPHTIERIDLTKTELQDPTFAADWLKQLLYSGALRTEVNAHVSVAPKLSHIYFEEQNSTRLEGVRQLGFGYPMVIERDEHNPFQLMVAPLFVWSLEMHPSPNRIDTWTLSRQQGDPIHVNEVLLRQLLMRHKIDNRDRFREAVVDNRLDDDTLTRLCNMVAVQLDSTGNISSLDVRSCPTPAELKELEEGQVMLSWSGVIGLFPPEQVQSATLLRKMINTDAPTDAPPPPLQDHAYGLLATDPAQAQVLQQLDAHRAMVVDGGVSTGKTQLLANLCSNALSAGGTAIVTARSSMLLQQVQFELMRAGLENYTFAFRQDGNDMEALLGFLRQRHSALKSTDSEPMPDYAERVAQLRELEHTIRIASESRDRVLFGEAKFREIVGAFLGVQRQHGRELLLGQVDARQHDFTEDAYEHLSQVVLKSEALYSRINSLRHPLNRLHASLFTDYPSDESLRYLEDNIQRMRKRAEELRYQLITVQAAYGESLRQHYEAHFAHMLSVVQDIKQTLADNKRRFGDAFEERSGFFAALSSTFSRNSRELDEARNGLQRDYRRLQELHREQPYFVYNFEKVSRHDVATIGMYTRDYETQLRDWHRNITSFVQRDGQQLNHHTALIQTGQRDRLQMVGISVEDFFSTLNEARLYAEEIPLKEVYLPGQEQQLEQVLDLLNETSTHLDDFDAYYDWRAYWLQLTEAEQQLVQSLTRVNPKEWHAAFSAWFYHFVLDEAHTLEEAASPDVLPQLAKQQQELTAQMLAYICQQWDERQRQAIKVFKKANKQTASALFGRVKKQDALLQVPSEVLLPRLAQLLRDMCPVMMATPTYLTEVLVPALQPEVDLLLVENADTIPAARSVMLLPIARRQVAFTDRTRAMLTEEDSLADYLTAIGAERTALNYLHESRPQVLADWSQATDAQVQLRQLHPYSYTENDSITVVAAAGRYDEQALTNDVEARRIMSLLNDIQRDRDDKYPSVGIVCFTLPQRNLVQAYFLKIQQKRAAGSEKINRLQEEGMQVLHISELRGQTYDVLIAGFTYGMTDASGSMSEAVETFNDDHGAAMLSNLLGAYRQHTYLLHSIPKADLRLFGREPQHRGTYLLAQLLDYGMSDAPELAHSILEQLRTASNVAPAVESDLFKAEVMRAIRTYFPDERLVDASPVKGLQIPVFSVLPAHANQPTALVFCDTVPLTSGAHTWVAQLLNDMRSEGYSLHFTSPTDWWKSPEQAVRKLAAGIVHEDEDYDPTPTVPATAPPREDREEQQKLPSNGAADSVTPEQASDEESISLESNKPKAIAVIEVNLDGSPTDRTKK